MSLMTSLAMEGKSAEEQAQKAIAHTLNVIKTNEAVGYHLGIGTETFSLLTEAAATLFGEPVEKVRESFCPKIGSKR